MYLIIQNIFKNLKKSLNNKNKIVADLILFITDSIFKV